MQRMLIALGALIVLASPASSQNWSRWDDRDSSDHEDRGRSKRDYPRWHDMDDHHGSGHGARFMVRSGDSEGVPGRAADDTAHFEDVALARSPQLGSHAACE